MKRILNKTPIPALLCSAVLAASPAFAQGVGAGTAASPMASPLAGAPGTGLSAGAGTSLGTTSTLNSNAAANPGLGAPSPSASIGADAGINPNASVSANPGGLAANSSINRPTPGSNGVNTSDQQTAASQMAQRAQANANAAQLSQFNRQGLTNGQAAGAANGAAPAQ
jgi:hypothetical protein